MQKAVPLHHQNDGAKILAVPRRGILADLMGLGKTCTACLWLTLIDANRTVVIAPKEVCRNLGEELGKWTDLPIIGLKDRPKAQRDVFLTSLMHVEKFIILINLEAWSRDKSVIERLLDLQVDALVIDEAHNINNLETSAFKGVRELAFGINKCPVCAALLKPKYKCSRANCGAGGRRNRFRFCMDCGHQQALLSLPECSCGTKPTTLLKRGSSVTGLLELTGTLIINGPTDAYPLVHLVDPMMFPTEKAYKDTYTERHGTRRTFREGAQEQLIHALGSRYVARGYEDAGIELPPQTTEILEYDRDRANYKEQWEAYDFLEESFAMMLGEDVIPVTEIIVQITRLRQMVTWPKGINTPDGSVNINRSQKLDIVESKINEYLKAQQRIVAFSQFKAPLHELARRLGDQAVVYDGSTPNNVRSRVREDFAQAHKYPQWSVLLCNYKTAGTSLTLVGATQAIRIDEEWSPAKNRQADGRISRIGQTQATRVHIPRIAETVDEWMAKLNEFKEEMSGPFSQMDILKAIKER